MHVVYRYLHNNALRCVQASSFANLRALNALTLHKNELHTLPEGAFRDLRALSHLTLYENAWRCDCRLRWLADLSARRRELLRTDSAECRSPEKLARSQLVRVPAVDFACPLGAGGAATNASASEAAVGEECDVCVRDRPCRSGGVCRTSAFNTLEFTCECPRGFVGLRCERQLNACEHNPCFVCFTLCHCICFNLYLKYFAPIF